MRSLDEIDAWLEGSPHFASPEAEAAAYLAAGEEILENWLLAHDRMPTQMRREGFRILALQRQGAKGDPSFNACRESCREMVYRHNLVVETAASPAIMAFVLRHLYLFVRGKLENAGLGEFCCASRPLRTSTAAAGGPA